MSPTFFSRSTKQRHECSHHCVRGPHAASTHGAGGIGATPPFRGRSCVGNARKKYRKIEREREKRGTNSATITGDDTKGMPASQTAWFSGQNRGSDRNKKGGRA